MNDINRRFKQLRIAYGKSQEEWGVILGITKSGVSEIESGRRNVTDKHLVMLNGFSCNGNYANVNWLRDGSGDMFRTLSFDESMGIYIEELLNGEETTTKNAIKAFLTMYMKMNDASRAVMDKAIDDWLDEMKRMRD